MLICFFEKFPPPPHPTPFPPPRSSPCAIFARLLGEQRIKLHYGDDVADTSSLKQIFCSNLGYKNCPTPIKEVRGGAPTPFLL